MQFVIMALSMEKLIPVNHISSFEPMFKTWQFEFSKSFRVWKILNRSYYLCSSSLHIFNLLAKSFMVGYHAVFPYSGNNLTYVLKSCTNMFSITISNKVKRSTNKPKKIVCNSYCLVYILSFIIVSVLVQSGLNLLILYFICDLLNFTT